MARICLASTATAIIPSCISLLTNPKKSKFLFALVNSSLAFFLFSFQVHEKSILIAAIPVILIFPVEPFMSFWFLQVATFSMFPLLVKDGLLVAFLGLSGFFFGFTKLLVDYTKEEKHKDKNFLQILWRIGRNKTGKMTENLAIFAFLASSLVEIALVFAFFFVPPPENLPFLHPLLISAFSCCHFALFFVYFNVKQVFYQ
jgi:alpha-1,3-glucosyltransferase